MKTGKREDRLFFIIGSVSLLPLYNAAFFGHRDIPSGFFPRDWKGQQQNETI
jgi:hypothetical protein